MGTEGSFREDKAVCMYVRVYVCIFKHSITYHFNTLVNETIVISLYTAFKLINSLNNYLQTERNKPQVPFLKFTFSQIKSS
jgi:hypothetical protein